MIKIFLYLVICLRFNLICSNGLFNQNTLMLQNFESIYQNVLLQGKNILLKL